jgi:hypothetical protein
LLTPCTECIAEGPVWPFRWHRPQVRLRRMTDLYPPGAGPTRLRRADPRFRCRRASRDPRPTDARTRGHFRDAPCMYVRPWGPLEVPRNRVWPGPGKPLDPRTLIALDCGIAGDLTAEAWNTVIAARKWVCCQQPAVARGRIRPLLRALRRILRVSSGGGRRNCIPQKEPRDAKANLVLSYWAVPRW